MMYEDLVMRLKKTSMDFGELDHVSVLLLEAADAIEDLITALTASNEVVAKSKPKWIPVTERLPEEKINPYTHDFEPIICSTNFGDVRVYKYGTPIGWDEPHFWNGAGIVDWYVTHWMPLPEAPKDGE